MKVIATISSKFGSNSYVSLPVGRVENYQVDSALDTDTDQFSIDIGDPSFDLIDLLRRDDEVRVGLSAATFGTALVPILQGYGDTVVLRHDGSLSIQGRDLSAAAVDTTAEPYNWGDVNPGKQIITPHARALGISRLNVSPIKTIRKLYTDGSESEWDLWYRIVRKRQMWIWCSSDGTLNVDQLNYAAKPTYFFGVPSDKYPNEGNWIRIQEAEITKNTQTRIGEVWVFGETGKVGFGPIKARDTTIKDWIKKPRKIITADAAHTNRAEALKEANEEIFESIIGSLEISIRISDPGQPIRQNTVAVLNVPKMGYQGEFFVVGVQMYNGSDGAYQQIRLREKKYALTKRVPTDPGTKDAEDNNKSGYSLGTALGLPKNDWGEYFVNAAKDNHGGWDYDLFLATLLAICQAETSFMNVREGHSNGPEWSPPPNEGYGKATSPADQHHHGDEASGGALAAWRVAFGNAAGNPHNPYGREAGVGPMQLTDLGLKEMADKRVGISDEYVGGRWHPEANIWVGAYTLAQKLQGLPQTEANFWEGVMHYNGSGPAAVAYMKSVRAAVNQTFLPQVKTAEKQAQTLPGNSSKTLKEMPGAPDKVKRIVNFAERQLGEPYSASPGSNSGPNSWDCSGLVWGSYHAAGLDSDIGGRQSTWGYWQDGKGWGNLRRITEKADLLPGDMVFFDNHFETPPGHMGLYYGDGQMIVAPHTGGVVEIESISVPGLTYMGGMRLKGMWPQSEGSHPIGTGW